MELFQVSVSPGIGSIGWYKAFEVHTARFGLARIQLGYRRVRVPKVGWLYIRMHESG